LALKRIVTDGKSAEKAVFFHLPGPYIRFLAGLLISRMGDSFYSFALPWISYELTRSATVMASLFATGVLPIVLFGSFVGAVVDRLDRRRLMLVADAARAGLVALVPALHLFGLLQIWHLYAISFTLAVLTLLFDVASLTVIPHLVDRRDLTTANASYQSVNQAADLLGPVLAGAIVAAIGGYHILWLDALSFAATFLSILRIRIPQAESHSSTPQSPFFKSLFKDIRDGFVWLVRDKLNLSLSLQAMTGNFGLTVAHSVLMYYMLSILRLNAGKSGINFTLIGIGGLAGSLLVPYLEKRFRRGVLIPVLLLMGTVGWICAGQSRYWLAPGLAIAFVAACNSAWNAMVMSVRQETVPEKMLGRVLGFSRMFTRLAMPVGAMVGGWISEWEPAGVFVVAAGSKFLEVIIALVSPIRKLK
jgi:MFS family permease